MEFRTDKNFFLTKVIPCLTDGFYVMVGVSAMCYNGTSTDNIYEPELLMDRYPSLDNLRVIDRVHYFYSENLYFDRYLTPLKENPNIRIPSRERAFIECIKHDLRFIDEGYFLETLERYVTGLYFDYDKMKEVAEFFEVPMEKVDYWIGECEGFNIPGVR